MHFITWKLKKKKKNLNYFFHLQIFFQMLYGGQCQERTGQQTDFNLRSLRKLSPGTFHAVFHFILFSLL